MDKKKLIEIIEKFRDKKILVIGDIMLDKYVIGDVSRISPEAPVQVVKVTAEGFAPGGAANVANNLSALKGAPFILWIQDLSMKDPYYILPILMGVSMFMQQRFLSPQQRTDQQKIFSFLMPVIITFVFLSFPSGLVLYWLTYNILMIFVQWYIRKQG